MSNVVTVETRQIQVPQINADALAEVARKQLSRMQSFAITSVEDSDIVSEQLSDNKTTMVDLETARTAYTKPLNDIVKSINEQFKTVYSVREEIERVGKTSIAAFQRAEAERARKAQEEANRKAAEERAKAAADAEAKLKEAQALEQAAQAKGDTVESDAAIQTAQVARQEAAELTTIASTTYAAPVAVAKTSGASIREKWEFQVFDKLALMKWIVNERPDMVNLLIEDGIQMKNFVKLTKSATPAPGVNAWDAGSVSIRRKAA